MRPTGRLAIAVIVLAIVFQASDVTAQPTRADYDRPIGLREAYQALVTNVPDAAVWIGETSRFWDRRSVAGGHEFVMMDAATQQKRQPFDHQRLAAALSSAVGGSWTGVTLPFNTFRFADEERAIEVQIEQERWTCTLAEYRCTKGERVGAGAPLGALRGVNGPVRGPHLTPSTAPRKSPDGNIPFGAVAAQHVQRPGGARRKPRRSAFGHLRQLRVAQTIRLFRPALAWRHAAGLERAGRQDHNDNQRWRVAPVALRPSAAPSG